MARRVLQEWGQDNAILVYVNGLGGTNEGIKGFLVSIDTVGEGIIF